MSLKTLSLQSMYLTRTSGFTLVEVLVSVLILAIGLLGMAGLQVTGLRNNHNAYLRSQATQLAYDLADRMRANPTGLANYSGAATSDDCQANACTPAQMAGYDLKQWNDALAAQLPPPPHPMLAGSVAVAGSIYSITISWSELENGVPAIKTFVTSFQP